MVDASLPLTGIDLEGVQKTLLLPLWGRAVETRKPHPLLVDRTAVRIIESLDYDFSTIAKNISPISQLAWIVRCLHADRTISEFRKQHPRATIVNLGCGLDTTFERIDDRDLDWYDLDLPDVIELRKKLIPEGGRRKVFACSLLDDGWLQKLKTGEPVLLIAMGVLYYLQESDVRAFLIKLADALPGSGILFDACSHFGRKVANEKVIKAAGMAQSAILQWSVERPKEMLSWDGRIAMLAEYPMFRKMKHGLSIRDKWGTFLSDTLRVMMMVHLRLGSRPAA